MNVNSVSPVQAPARRNPCGKRKKFASKKHAEFVAMKMNQKHHKQVYVEPCSKCNGWHVS